MAAAAGAVAATAAHSSEANVKRQHSHNNTAVEQQQNQTGAKRRTRHSASVSDNSSSSDPSGSKGGLTNGGSGGGGAAELLVFDDDVQVPLERRPPPTAENSPTEENIGVITPSTQQQQQNVVNTRRSVNSAGTQNQQQLHADLKRHRSSGNAPQSPTSISAADYAALAEFLPSTAAAASSPDSHDLLISPNRTSLTNAGGAVSSTLNFSHPAPAALQKQNSSPPQSNFKFPVSLSPHSTREFLATLHREQLGIAPTTAASLLPSYADATGSSSTTTTPAPIASTSAAPPSAVVVPPRKTFNVTRVTEDAPKPSVAGRKSSAEPAAAARPATNLVDYDPRNFFDTLGPLVSSTKTLADYRPGIGASSQAAATNDSSTTAGGSSRHGAQSAGKPAYQHAATGSYTSSTTAPSYPLTSNTEESIPFLNSQYRLPSALRRSQRARSEYLPYPTVSATTSQQPPTPMVSSFRLAGCLGGPGQNAGSNNGPPTGTTSSTVAAAVKGSALGAALLTGSPMSTLPYKAPSKSPRYLPVSIQAAGYAPTTMEMKDLPPLGSADSQKHLNMLHNSNYSNNNNNSHVAFPDHHPTHAATLVGTASAGALTGTADSIHGVGRNAFDTTHTTEAAGTEFLSVPTYSSFSQQKPHHGEHSTTLDTPFSHENEAHAAAVRMAVQNSAEAGNHIAGGSMSRPNFHRSTTLPLYMADAATASGKSPGQSTQTGFGHRPGKKRARARLLHRTGNYNMIGKNIPHRRIRLVSDIWNTLVDLQWRYILLLFLLSYFLTWTLFAFVYWLISLSHGDFDAENLNSADWRPCVQNLRSFTTAYLFSVESQHTIGYGFRYITDECAEAIIFLCLQSAIGAAIQAFMTGLVFTKVQRPTKRAQTLLFSKHAVICTRDGQLCLLFRVGNMRRSLIIQSSVTAQLVHHRKTIEGELLPFHQHEMHIQLDSMSSSAFLAWPMTACHIINDESPLYDLDKQSMQNARFELIVTLEGVIESTGQTLQARTSYLPEEILWGFRFAKLLSYRQSSGQYVVNFERFHKVEIAPETPVCSAAQLEVAKRAFVARQLEDEDETAQDDENDEMLNHQLHYRQQQSQHAALANNFGNGAGLIRNDSEDRENDDDDDDENDAGKLPLSAPPLSSTSATGMPKSRVATITSLLAHEAEHASKPESTTSSNQFLQLPSAANRRAKFFSGGDDNDINDAAATANNSPNASSPRQHAPHPVARKFSQQSHSNTKQNVYERKSSGDLPVLFTLGAPTPTTTTAAASTTHAHADRDSLSRHASEAEMELRQQQQQRRRKRGSAGKIMLGSSDEARIRNASEADNSNSLALPNRGHKISAGFSRPKSHSSLRVAAGLPPPPPPPSGQLHHPGSQQVSDEEQRNRKIVGLEVNRSGAGFETEQESAAHVWTSPENRKYLELLKKELPEHDQQLLRRRKPSTKKLHHHGAELPSNDADAYEESMARMRRLGSILDDPKYTFDLTAEADELWNNSRNNSGNAGPSSGLPPVRPIRTHQRVDSVRSLSRDDDRVSDDDGEGGYVRDDEPDETSEQTFPTKPTGAKPSLGAHSLKGSSVRLSDLLPLSNMQQQHEVADKPIAEEVDVPGGSPTHQNIVVVMPTRVQSDVQMAGGGAGRDTMHIQNETAGGPHHINTFRKSVGNNNNHNNAVQHAEMGRRQSANAAVTGSAAPRLNSTASQLAGGQPSRHQQSRHASVKRSLAPQQQHRTNSTVEADPSTWLPFPAAPPQQPPPPAPP